MIELPSKLNEIEPTKDAPFAKDMLDRAKYSYVLRGIVDTYANEGCVLAVTGEWGTGKTTFVKMWRMQMEQFNYRTVYFNVWKTDYISDPLIALIGELNDVIGVNANFDKICSKAARIISGAGFAMVEATLKQFTGMSAIGLQEAIRQADTMVQESIKEYSCQKNTLKEFKKLLSDYVADVKEGQMTPVIFIIDELDRCNPHYAVKVLERVKHLFDIPNIIFILPISKKQLECSIKGFYGSESIDASNYLRRFIDLEYELPEPNVEKFCDYLYEHYKFQDVFNSSQDQMRKGDNIELFKRSVQRLFARTKIDLRTLDKIYSRSRLVVQTTGGQYNCLMDVVFLLCYIRTLHYDVYDKIRNHSYTLQQLVDAIENIFPRQLMDENSCDNLDFHCFAYTVADILCAYNKNQSGEYEPDILPKTKDDTLKLKLNVFTKDKLHEALVTTSRNIYCRWYYCKELFNTIDLLNSLR